MGNVWFSSFNVGFLCFEDISSHELNADFGRWLSGPLISRLGLGRVFSSDLKIKFTSLRFLVFVIPFFLYWWDDVFVSIQSSDPHFLVNICGSLLNSRISQREVALILLSLSTNKIFISNLASSGRAGVVIGHESWLEIMWALPAQVRILPPTFWPSIISPSYCYSFELMKLVNGWGIYKADTHFHFILQFSFPPSPSPCLYIGFPFPPLSSYFI